MAAKTREQALPRQAAIAPKPAESVVSEKSAEPVVVSKPTEHSQPMHESLSGKQLSPDEIVALAKKAEDIKDLSHASIGS